MESVVKGSFEMENCDNSPENLITPYEDINTKQQKITAERFPDIILELCDNCLWSCMCFNPKDLILKCPICSSEISQIPMSIDEVCHMELNNKRGIEKVL
jgi:hypothetical protein